jgi:hypothetical protein
MVIFKQVTELIFPPSSCSRNTTPARKFKWCFIQHTPTVLPYMVVKHGLFPRKMSTWPTRREYLQKDIQAYSGKGGRESDRKEDMWIVWWCDTFYFLMCVETALCCPNSNPLPSKEVEGMSWRKKAHGKA